jgi:AcrR family transcriptional regulator
MKAPSKPKRPKLPPVKTRKSSPAASSPAASFPVPPRAPSSKGLRQAAKDETRAAILLVAREELTQRGFEQASLREIARLAGVATGTVALHFGDKLGLVQAMLHTDLEVVLNEAFETVPKKPLAAQLRHVASCVFAYYRANERLSAILLQASLLCEEPWRGRFVLQAGFAHARLSELVVQAIARKELPSDVAAPLVALTFLSFHYFALISWAQRAIADPVALVDQLMSVHLNGLKKGIK